MLLLRAGSHTLENHGVVAAHRDEEIGAEEEIDVVERHLGLVVHVLQHRKNVVIVLFRLGTLWPMATVLDLQRVELKPLRKLIELRRGGIRNVVPGKMREDRIHERSILEPARSARILTDHAFADELARGIDIHASASRKRREAYVEAIYPERRNGCIYWGILKSFKAICAPSSVRCS